MGEVILGGEAVRAGVVTRHELARWYTPLYRGVFVPKGVDVSLRDRAIGAWLATGRKGVIAGLAAAALHGAPWIDADIPIEVTGVKRRTQDGLIIRTDMLADDEIVRRSGLPVTSRTRTAFDLGRLLDRSEALARLDALMWNQAFSIDEVARLADRRPRAHGVGQLRDLLPLVDGGAASPKESRIRLWLLDCGFPRPQTQIPILEDSRPVAFLDLGWRQFKVAVEYDGDHHRKNREQYVKDIARLRMLEERGWLVIRVIAEDRPAHWLARTEAALQKRGCRLAATEMQKFIRTLAA
ncbi:DUF559 domain-containing protein [Mycobacterium sp. 4D054]|uniref:DUF559 domain-containing protein n=1 Tax=unclassified Mycobacterium TaxID=2642494 RepID=UPI0021B4ACA1|nr:DUF559 domain-containing protein [Mycobacterium sp. SMC-8]UXA13223.1 DUF559 domain-containing protein [Mycobacterium sp. SMC-8]